MTIPRSKLKVIGVRDNLASMRDDVLIRIEDFAKIAVNKSTKNKQEAYFTRVAKREPVWQMDIVGTTANINEYIGIYIGLTIAIDALNQLLGEETNGKDKKSSS